MYKNIFTTLTMLLILSSVTFGQSGKISGKVIDQQSQEPLIGANILIVGTTYGAATDVNGNFSILQVPVGEYNIKASYIGYQGVTIQGIRVTSGLTVEVNFNLPSESIATEEIIIVAVKPLIEKSSTNAIRIITDLENMPIRNLDDIVALQPGVVRQNDKTFIRGSRPDETGYVLEGADIKNIVNRDGGSLVTVIGAAVHELLVQAGGYTAEFGNANAGIIQRDLKTGSDEYHFSIRAETDNFGNANSPDKFLGTYSYGYSDYIITASGPLFSDKLKLFLSGENRFVRDYNPQFLSGNPTAYSDGALFDTTRVYDSGRYGGEPNDSRILTWDGGSVPGRMQNRYSFTGTALLDLKPLMVKASGAFTWQKTRANDQTFNSVSPSQDIGNVLDLGNIFNLGRLPIQDNSNLFLNLKGTYFLSEKSFLEANVNFLDNRLKTYDPYFEDDFLSYNDSLKASEFGWTYADYTNPPDAYDFNEFPFSRPGDLLTNYTKDQRNYLGGSMAFTSQFQNHELKVGGSYQRWTIRRYGVTGATSLLELVRQNPDLSRNPDSLIFLFQNQGFRQFNNYGYDILGNEIDAGPFAPKHPVFASGYIQDKVEISDLIINAGIRYDYIDMDSWAWANPKLPTTDETTHLTSDLLKGSTFSYVSPRLGFSFPVTDRTVFHLQYGKFVQSPSLDVAYRGIFQAAQQITATNLFTNPIAYSLEPIRTTQYEIGFTQQFTDFAAFDLTAFYKDIKGQLQYATIKTLPGAAKSQYAAFINQDFSTTKGLEFSLRIRRVERIRAEINYTFSDSKGTNSFSNSGIGSTEINNNVPTVLLPLTYDQANRGSILIDYRFGEDDSGPILQQLGVVLLFTFNSGHPYTLAQGIDATGLGQTSAYTGGLIPTLDSRGRRTTGPVNQSTTPWFYNIDLRIDKTVNISNLDVNFYVAVQNLLNTKNVINVYDRTGNGYDDGFLGSQTAVAYSDRFNDLYRSLNLENRQAALSLMGVDMFSAPRQLRAGVLVNF
ncbi:MAG: TonB-dependent receptor [Ignavibacteria bacterium]|nr:TonB-dependent receptor [Ignavibacteria bacterium]